MTIGVTIVKFNYVAKYQVTVTISTLNILGGIHMDLFLYIIWSNAYYKKNEILADIEETFKVHKVIEVEWKKERFSENLSRFYGQKLPQNSFKEKACGVNPFTLVILEDENPIYEVRKTSRGDEEVVNINVFDKKMLYRKWTTKDERRVHSRIHGTNSPEETEHDLTLLLGMSPKDFLRNKEQIPDRLVQDIVGADGWESLEQMFYVLNHTCRYVVLRNFEKLPGSFYVGDHADIDLLCDNFEEIKRILKANLVFVKKNRVQCFVNVSGYPIQFDFRYVGDGYYDKKWENSILKRRVFRNGIYIPCEQDYKYMILYHALIHKLTVADDYIERLNKMFGEEEWNANVLNKYLEDMGYQYTEPMDLSVYFNKDIAKVPVSLKRNFKMLYINVRRKIRRLLGEKR